MKVLTENTKQKLLVLLSGAYRYIHHLNTHQVKAFPSLSNRIQIKLMLIWESAPAGTQLGSFKKHGKWTQPESKFLQCCFSSSSTKCCQESSSAGWKVRKEQD